MCCWIACLSWYILALVLLIFIWHSDEGSCSEAHCNFRPTNGRYQQNLYCACLLHMETCIQTHISRPQIYIWTILPNCDVWGMICWVGFDLLETYPALVSLTHSNRSPYKKRCLRLCPLSQTSTTNPSRISWRLYGRHGFHFSIHSGMDWHVTMKVYEYLSFAEHDSSFALGPFIDPRQEAAGETKGFLQ